VQTLETGLAMELKKRDFIAASLGAGLGAGLATDAKAQSAPITQNLGAPRPGEAINSG
jgi:hypothetical protein